MKELYKALAAFQQEVPVIHKDAKGYNYSYTNLATIFEVITPLLKKHGLGFYQPLGVGTIKTIIFHTDSGETIESETSILSESLEYIEVSKIGKDGKPYNIKQILGFEGMNRAQAYGSMITYFRRYALSSILGLITDTDSDSRNKRMEDNELLEELKVMAIDAGVKVTDTVLVFKKKGYDYTKEYLETKINEQS